MLSIDDGQCMMLEKRCELRCSVNLRMIVQHSLSAALGQRVLEIGVRSAV